MTRFARDLAALPIRIEPPQAPASWSTVIQVATEHNLTAYDAAYLELAHRTACLWLRWTPICAKLLAPRRAAPGRSIARTQIYGASENARETIENLRRARLDP